MATPGFDIDECLVGSACPDNSRCQNIDGNFHCACNSGFDGDRCMDIDECSRAGTCHENATCHNNKGSYLCFCRNGFFGDGDLCRKGDCDDRMCPWNQKCVSPTTTECECREGFRSFQEFCQDINECLQDHDCGNNATCVNFDGDYNCVCDSGYSGDGKQCYISCKEGYERDAKLGCVDFDECSTSQHKCDQNSDCLNTSGSYECNCRDNFFGDGKFCFPGECSEFNCPENQICVSSSKLDCKCKEGYFNSSSSCVDIDECEEISCGQNAACSNSPGSFDCKCDRGFTGDGISCSDLDECTENQHDCDKSATCTNSVGNFTCTCPVGYSG